MEKNTERRFKSLINQSKHLPSVIKNFINRLRDNMGKGRHIICGLIFLPKD